MKKRRRYQLTESQLTPVIKYIHENYPYGVTSRNIDQLTGADADSYDHIRDVTLSSNVTLIFDVETDRGNTVEKEVGLDENEVTKTIESLLPKYGYDIHRFPEWEVNNAFMANGNIILSIVGDNKQHQIPIDAYVALDWLPDLDAMDISPRERDPDEYRD